MKCSPCSYVQLGNTALHIASRQNFLEVAQALCEHKVDARLTNKTRVSDRCLSVCVLGNVGIITERTYSPAPSCVQRPFHDGRHGPEL